MDGLNLGTVLVSDDGHRLMVVGWISDAYQLCSIPEGMTPHDFGREFCHVPTVEDPTAYGPARLTQHYTITTDCPPRGSEGIEMVCDNIERK